MPHALVLLAVLIVAAPRLVLAAIPGADDPKAYTDRDFREALLEFNRRTMGKMYNAVGKRDAKWDAAAAACLEQLAQVFTYAGTVMPDGRSEREVMMEVRKHGKAARDAGCDDPLITYSYGVAIDHVGLPAKQVRPLIERGAAGLYSSRYPINRAVAAARRELGLMAEADPQAQEAAWERFKDLTLTWIASWDYQDVDRRIVLYLVSDALAKLDMRRRKDFNETLALQGGADPWVSHVLQGRYAIRAGWEHRGGGFAHTVTDAGWKGLREHMDKARAHLEAAWKLEPKYPESAVELITVAMAHSDRPEAEMRLWFDRAVAAQFDYENAYSTYLFGIYPRWHGSHDAMYAFGKECAATKRFDTRVPYQLILALERIASDGGGSKYWRRTGVYDEVKTVLDSMAREQSVEHYADYYRSYLAAVAWRADRFDDARAQLEALGERFQPRVFDWMNVVAPLAISQIYAMQPGPGERVRLAEQQAAAGQRDEAAATYRVALAALPEGHRGAPFLRGRAKQLEWQRQFEAGEWVTIQPDQDLSGWSPRQGEWTVDGAGGLVGTYTPTGARLYCQADFLGSDFIVEGNVELGELSCDAGIVLTNGNPSSFYGLWARQRKAQSTFQRYMYPTLEEVIELKPVNAFRFVFSRGRVTGEWNGQPVFEPTDVSYIFNGSPIYLGVGGQWGGKGSTIRYTGLRIRKVDDDKS